MRVRIWDYSRVALLSAALGCHWLPWVQVSKGLVWGVQTTLGFWSAITLAVAGVAILAGRWRGSGRRKRWQFLELTCAAAAWVGQAFTYWTVVTTPTQTKIFPGGLLQGGIFKIKIPPKQILMPRSLVWGMDVALSVTALTILAAAVALVLTIRRRAQRNAHRKLQAATPELAGTSS